jgi:hypothetical protein
VSEALAVLAVLAAMPLLAVALMVPELARRVRRWRDHREVQRRLAETAPERARRAAEIEAYREQDRRDAVLRNVTVRPPRPSPGPRGGRHVA